MKKLLSALLAAYLLLSVCPPASALGVEDAKQLLEQYYVDFIPDDIMEMDSLEDILSALGDPYTDYFSAQEYDHLLSDLNGASFVGIGVTISSSFEDGFAIRSFTANSPAQEAGLQVGDVLVGVDGTTLTAQDNPALLIRGEEGTSVTLTVRRSSGQLEDVKVVRHLVQVPIVTTTKVGSAAYIQCDTFGESTADAISQAITTLEQQVETYILDLRGNPGGMLQSAIDTTSLFVGGAAVVSSFRDGSDRYTFYATPSSAPDLTDKPLLILLDADSASASELFAAAMRDYRAGISLGQRSFGKGIAQTILDQSSYPELFDEDSLKITVARFFSPYGATNHIVGVLPTLLLSEENTAAAALLLSCGSSPYPEHHLKLELAGQTLYVNLFQAEQPEYRTAFTELLEALPPSAVLYYGGSSGWETTPITPAALAEKLGLSFTPRTFSDVAGTQFETAINTLACYRLLSGYSDGTFRPDQVITRAEFCAMAAAALNLPAPSGSPDFSDISAGDWYAGAVGAMAQRGFISGYDDSTFRPNATITCEEMVTILANVSAWTCMDGYDYYRVPLSDQDQQAYSQYSPWARSSARNLKQLGALVDGIVPQQAATRQIAAGLLYATMEGAGLLWD